ncbi:hypothetical protein DSO57_1027257 [Entomophthora muscae]|uniref:Uncharacterized protein n=1 Tax=Entomophthora muscae TaxID=34485 RepID=A0ACC2SEV0_9FUNG|nr:hypothetical protein DSO57_1027257 [Entomophthora muscae]
MGNYISKRSQPSQIYEPILELIVLRKHLVQGYKLISTSSSFVPFDNWLTIIEEAWSHYKLQNFNGPTEPLAASIKFELLTVRHMILAQKAMCEYDLKGVTINLYFAHSQYIQWRSLSYAQRRIQPELEQTPEPSNVLSIFTSLAEQFNFKPAKTPLQVSNLMKWTEKLYDHLASKMTLYFHRSLLDREKVVGGDERTLWRRPTIDFQSIIRTFRKRSGAHSVAIIFEVDSSRPFSRMGFECLMTPYQPPSGLESFPCIFSYPEDPPLDHWPNLVSMIMSDNQTCLLRKQEFTSPSLYPSQGTNDSLPYSSTSTLSLAGANALSTALSVAGFKYPSTSLPAGQSTSSPITNAQQLNDTNLSSSVTTTSSIPPAYLPTPTQFYDRKVGATYYLSRIDPRITLAVVFLDKHSTRDTVALDFVKDLTDHLRLTHITQQLARAE